MLALVYIRLEKFAKLFPKRGPVTDNQVLEELNSHYDSYAKSKDEFLDKLIDEKIIPETKWQIVFKQFGILSALLIPSLTAQIMILFKAACEGVFDDPIIYTAGIGAALNLALLVAGVYYEFKGRE